MKNMTEDRRWVLVLIVIFTAVFRTILLAIKPPHFDEGVNGWFLDDMTGKGYFEYDPGNYHGPLHFYILFLFKVMFGRNLWALRLPVVILSTATVWLVTKFDRFMDRRACWLAAAAMAVSPGMEFYGRYAIHETELVLFLIMVVWGGAGIWRFGGKVYLWVAALGATGMILTKETYIIHFTAFALAGLCLWVLEKLLPSAEPFPRSQAGAYKTRDLCAVTTVCAALVVFFYSGTFLNPMFYTVSWIPMRLLAWRWQFPMPEFLIKTFYEPFTEWTKTGQGGQSGHEKVWWYWFKLIAIYEWPVMAGMYISQFYVWPKSGRFIRYLLIYGWGAFTAYSIVRYKTPWCVITIMWPFLFLFGHFFIEWMDTKDGRWPATITAALLLAASFAMSVRLSFFRYTDEREEYVYVQTLPDIYKLTGPLFKLVARDPANYHLKGIIVIDSTHPLPWVLGDFTGLQYYSTDLPEGDMDAAFLLVDKDHEEEVQKKLKENYFTDDFHLRAALDPVKLYLNYNKFHDLFPGRKPEFNQGVPVPAPADPDDSKDDTP